MGYQIRNYRLSGNTVTISNELVTFDSEGVGEIESIDLFKEVSRLPHFSAVEVFGPKQFAEDEDEITDDDKIPTLVTDNMTQNELDARAKKLGITVTGTKKEKVKVINDFIISNF